MTTQITFPKRRSPTQSWGRGSDQARTPGMYWIEYNGVRVGYIAAKRQLHMETAEWQAFLFTYLLAPDKYGQIHAEMPRPEPHWRIYPTLRQAKADITEKWA
jgi:hypothetical protein